MSSRGTDLVNYVLYQAGWFACVLGAAADRPWLGFAIAAALIACHLVLTPDRGVEAGLLGLAAFTGAAVEAIQIAAGTYSFPSGTPIDGMAPPWLLAMWAQFATTFRYSLRTVLASPARALLFGGLGGPVAFLAGERLGALEFTRPLLPGVLRLSLAWLVALAIFSMATRRLLPADPARLRYRRPGR